MKTNRNRKKMNAMKTMLALCDFVGQTEAQVKQHLISAYEATQDEVDRFNILIAFENEDCYDGYSHFLLEEKATGQLFENHASHCSCYGYEGQFKPENTTVEYLLSGKAGFFSDDETAKAFITENFRLTNSKIVV